MTSKPRRCASGGSYPGCASWTWRARECASSWNSRRRHNGGRSAADSGGGHTHDRRTTSPTSQKRELGTWDSQSHRSKVIPTGTVSGSLGFLSRSPHLKDLFLNFVNWPKRHVGHLAQTGSSKEDSGQSQLPTRSHSDQVCEASGAEKVLLHPRAPPPPGHP